MHYAPTIFRSPAPPVSAVSRAQRSDWARIPIPRRAPNPVSNGPGTAAPPLAYRAVRTGAKALDHPPRADPPQSAPPIRSPWSPAPSSSIHTPTTYPRADGGSTGGSPASRRSTPHAPKATPLPGERSPHGPTALRCASDRPCPSPLVWRATRAEPASAPWLQAGSPPASLQETRRCPCGSHGMCRQGTAAPSGPVTCGDR